jgi:hypothetical protein
LALRYAEAWLLLLAAGKGAAVIVNRLFDGGSMFGCSRSSNDRASELEIDVSIVVTSVLSPDNG